MPAGPNWLHEVKYDGYRIIARKAGEEITLFSRSGLDWTVRFPAIAKALLTLPAESALLDGEVAFVLPSGITDFKSLQEHIDSPHPAIRYFVFDLLSLDGKDLRKKSLKERRALLGRLMSAKGISNYLVYADYVEGSGPEFFREACEHGLEGIMSKRADAPYRSGRGKDWLKIKCTKRRGVRHRRLQKLGRQREAVLVAVARDVRGREAELCGQGRHRFRLWRFHQSRQDVQIAGALPLSLRRGSCS